MLAKATAVLKSDIGNLPFPENEKSLRLTFWEKAIQEDVLNSIADFVRLGQNSSLLKDRASVSVVASYSKLFRRMLGSVYENLSIGNPIFFDGLICQSFHFGSDPESKWLDANESNTENLRELVHGEYGSVVRTNRIVRFYDENVIFVVKPDRLRYWIRSTAIRDVDDTLVDLQEQGY